MSYISAGLSLWYFLFRAIPDGPELFHEGLP